MQLAFAIFLYSWIISTRNNSFILSLKDINNSKELLQQIYEKAGSLGFNFTKLANEENSSLLTTPQEPKKEDANSQQKPAQKNATTKPKPDEKKAPQEKQKVQEKRAQIKKDVTKKREAAKEKVQAKAQERAKKRSENVKAKKEAAAKDPKKQTDKKGAQKDPKKGKAGGILGPKKETGRKTPGQSASATKSTSAAPKGTKSASVAAKTPRATSSASKISAIVASASSTSKSATASKTASSSSTQPIVATTSLSATSSTPSLSSPVISTTTSPVTSSIEESVTTSSSILAPAPLQSTESVTAQSATASVSVTNSTGDVYMNEVIKQVVNVNKNTVNTVINSCEDCQPVKNVLVYRDPKTGEYRDHGNNVRMHLENGILVDETGAFQGVDCKCNRDDIPKLGVMTETGLFQTKGISREECSKQKKFIEQIASVQAVNSVSSSVGSTENISISSSIGTSGSAASTLQTGEINNALTNVTSNETQGVPVSSPVQMESASGAVFSSAVPQQSPTPQAVLPEQIQPQAATSTQQGQVQPAVQEKPKEPPFEFKSIKIRYESDDGGVAGTSVAKDTVTVKETVTIHSTPLTVKPKKKKKKEREVEEEFSVVEKTIEIRPKGIECAPNCECSKTEECENPCDEIRCEIL